MKEPQPPFDAIVIGAGPAGSAAAIAAARHGCRVLLVEQQGFCGGMATAGMVNPLLGHYYRNPETGGDGSLIGGLFAELLQRLDARQARLRFRYGREATGVFSDAFDDAWLRVIYDELLAAAGVTTLYHTQLLDARCAQDRVQAVRVVCKTQVLEFAARTFIDATGDADLASLCGVACDIGREEDALCQPCSTMFRMGGVDKERLLL
jgi:flavin-dependent dehydrogenase